MFMVYGNNNELTIKGYADASFQIDKDNSRSHMGFVFILNGGAVTWRSSKQQNIAHSTTESQYIAFNEATKEAVWLNKFINNLGVIPSITELVEIFCDNEGAVALTKVPQDHKCTRNTK